MSALRPSELDGAPRDPLDTGPVTPEEVNHLMRWGLENILYVDLRDRRVRLKNGADIVLKVSEWKEALRMGNIVLDKHDLPPPERVGWYLMGHIERALGEPRGSVRRYGPHPNAVVIGEMWGGMKKFDGAPGQRRFLRMYGLCSSIVAWVRGANDWQVDGMEGTPEVMAAMLRNREFRPTSVHNVRVVRPRGA